MTLVQQQTALMAYVLARTRRIHAIAMGDTLGSTVMLSLMNVVGNPMVCVMRAYAFLEMVLSSVIARMDIQGVDVRLTNGHAGVILVLMEVSLILFFFMLASSYKCSHHGYLGR